jgi:prevent-host-death family protein
VIRASALAPSILIGNAGLEEAQHIFPFTNNMEQSTLKDAHWKGSTVLDISKDIQSLTSFRRKPGEFMKRLKKTKRPVVLTINGKAEAVVQDAESYQRLLDIAAQSDVFEAIRQGIDDIAHGRTRPAREVFLSLRRKYGIRR